MKVFFKIFTFISISFVLTACVISENERLSLAHTEDNGKWFLLKKSGISNKAQHTKHARIFGKYVKGYNYYVLKGIDKVQSTAMDGGGYFIGKDEKPTESPIGYELKLFDRPLIDPPRKTSYCSGVSFTAFVEALNMIFPDSVDRLDSVRYEAMRMQELDGSRREDGIKYWGHWNADGFGSHFALVQYSKMGKVVKPKNARPGDFVNISWKSGLGHSVIFLGWYIDKDEEKYIVYWSSQRGTNGIGDQVVNLKKVKYVKIVRLSRPENLFDFDITTPVDMSVPGDEVGL